MKTKLTMVVMFLVAIILSGCYLNDDVKTDQYGIQLNKNAIIRTVGPGVYTDWGWFSDLLEVPASTLTFSVADPEVATQDNQLVGITITVQVRRKGDDTSLRNMVTNWPALVNDEQLITVVSATAREGIKIGTRSFTLQSLLDDRNGLSSAIRLQLEADAEKYSTEIVNVTIENIALAAEYAALMQEKALLTAEIDKELRRQDLIKQKASNDKLEQEQRELVLNQQVLAEEAQTAVAVEIASREGKKTAAQASVYLINEKAYELERLRLLKEVLGDKAVFYFLPEGTDLTLFMSQTGGQIVPVEVP